MEEINQTNMKRFSSSCGSNIVLLQNNTVACRQNGFDNGLVFSEKPLRPGELFVVEIADREMLWKGNMQLGVTQTNPSALNLVDSDIPGCDSVSRSWVYRLPKLRPSVSENEICWPHLIIHDDIEVTKDTIRTCRGLYCRQMLQSNVGEDMSRVGSRVGVFYIPVNDMLADLLYVINGNIYGPFALNIPYKDAPVYAIFDIYGKTKKLKVVQVDAMFSLKHLCHDVIRKNYNMESVVKSSLPESIKAYILNDC